jgi:hypothetical protein
MTSMKVRSKPSSPHQATSRSNSSSLTPLRATQFPAGDGRELVRVQCIDRHVDPPHPDLRQLRRILGELAAVRGDRQLVEVAGAKMARQRPEQVHDVAPDQGLAAGHAQFADAEAHEGAAQAVELFQAEDLGLG